MNNKAVETLAIDAVRDSITATEILDQFIADNDKEPSWDGFIYVYKGKHHCNENFTGRVPVQVKGKLVKDMSKSQISYSIDVSHLVSYKNDVGAILFVVYINRDNLYDRKIYYETLTPVKIINYFKQINNQKNKSLKLREFPNDNESKSIIITDFLYHSKKQSSFTTQKILSFDDLQNSNIPYKFSIALSGSYINNHNFQYNTPYNREIYVYVTIEGSDILLPTDIIATSLQTTETVVDNIKVQDRCFYSKFQRIRTTQGETMLKIGDSLTLAMNSNDLKLNAKIELSSMLRRRATDLAFLIAAIKEKKFYIGNIEIAMTLPPKEDILFDIVNQENLLSRYNKIIDLLDELHIEEDVNLANLTTRQQKDIDTLITAILLKQKVNIKVETSPCILDFKLENIIIRLLITKDEQTNQHIIHDFFNLNLNLFGSLTDDDTPLRISPYSVLEPNDYLYLSNIDYNSILKSYQLILNFNPTVYAYANNDVLKMLLAYDKKNDIKLLDTARNITNWLFEQGNIAKDIVVLNQLQITKRQRQLNKEELIQLCKLTENGEVSEDIKVGAYLLLENQAAAEMHFLKLTSEEQENFKNYPIYKFWEA